MENRDGSLLTSYVLVTAEPGKTRKALCGISGLEFSGCRILTVEPVLGEYDILAKIEGQDIASLARMLIYGIQEVPGVLDVEVSLCCDRDDLSLQETSGRREPIDVVSVTNR